MHRNHWDIVASGHAKPDALWYATQLALRIASEHAGEVRLFTDGLKELATAVPGVDPTALQQRWSGIQLLDYRMARMTRPAQTVLLIFDSVLPGNYVRLLSERAGPSLALRLLRLDELPQLDTLQARGVEFPVRCLRQGDIANALGLTRPTQARGAATSPGVAALSHLHEPGERIVVVDSEADGTWRGWLSVLSTSPMPVRLLVLPCGAREEIVAELPMLEADPREVEWGNLRVSLIQGACRWSAVDALLQESDLVLTSREDLVVRAALVGTPAAYSGWRMPASVAEPSVLAAHTRLAHRLRFTTAKLTAAWRTGRPISQAWLEFCDAWPRILYFAARSATRLTALPCLADGIVHHAHKALRTTRSIAHAARSGASHGIFADAIFGALPHVGPLGWPDTQRRHEPEFGPTRSMVLG